MATDQLLLQRFACCREDSCESSEHASLRSWPHTVVRLLHPRRQRAASLQHDPLSPLSVLPSYASPLSRKLRRLQEATPGPQAAEELLLLYLPFCVLPLRVFVTALARSCSRSAALDSGVAHHVT